LGEGLLASGAGEGLGFNLDFVGGFLGILFELFDGVL